MRTLDGMASLCGFCAFTAATVRALSFSRVCASEGVLGYGLVVVLFIDPYLERPRELADLERPRKTAPPRPLKPGTLKSLDFSFKRGKNLGTLGHSTAHLKRRDLSSAVKLAG